MLNKLCIGTAQFGMNYGVNNKVGTVRQNEIAKILDLAYSNGINSLDTAKSYGQSEYKLGKYIKSREYYWDVTTKINNLNYSIEEQLIDSIKKLGCTSLNVLAHSANIYFNDSFFNQIISLKKKNFIKKVGLSVYSNENFEKILKYADSIDIIQLPLNILDTRLIKSGVLNKLNDSGVEIHARSIFLQGLLNMKKKQLSNDFIKILKPIKSLETFIKGEDINIAEYSLLFIYNLDFISKVIIGVETLDQFRSNIKSLKKRVNKSIFQDALKIEFEDEYILNPSLWN